MTQRSLKQLVLFSVLFVTLGLIALHVPLFQVVGAKAKFTLYDLMSPIATGFLGTLPGLVVVLATQLGNLVVTGAAHIDAATVVRILTPVAGALYFSKHRAYALIIPVVAMAYFWSTPAGQGAWMYGLYWLIPLAALPFSQRFLSARALGATFTAHAFGGAAYVYLFALPKTVWLGLIPVVAMERAIFAVGITVSYLLMNNLLAYLAAARFPKLKVFVEDRFAWINR